MNVAFLIYKRPALTAQVFAEIARAKPDRLFVIADGPRQAADAPLCAAARAVTERVDWSCQVERNYADTNLGCKRRGASGLDWVFNRVAEAIILEDDCLPHATFFRFCEEMLARFRDDARVGHISGSYVMPGHARTAFSYYYSRYAPIWGWATWRRAWRQFDVDLERWPEVRARGDHAGWFQTARERAFFAWFWDEVYAGRIDTWDGQWLFARLVHGTVSVVPSVNLISNLGFSPEAERTRDPHDPRANVPTEPMEFPLRHPPHLIVDQQADARFARQFELPQPRPLTLRQRLQRRFGDRSRLGQLARKLMGKGSGHPSKQA
jgi:hypothetical protein